MTSQPPPGAAEAGLSLHEALNRAHAHWKAAQADQAEMLCRRILLAAPGQSDALHLLGVMAHARGDRERALQHLRQACRASRAPAIYSSNLAEMCRQAGLLAEAEQAARRAVALSPGLAAGWNNLGIILQELGQFEESLACLERVVALEPNAAEVHNNLGNTSQRLGRLGQADAHYASALALNPGYAEAHSNRAHLLTALGRLDEAAAAARRAIDLNPGLADAYVNAAAIEMSRQRWPEALHWLDAVMAFAPAHPDALVARALTLRRLDRLHEALDCAERAVALVPRDARALGTLGQMLRAADRFDAALDCFDRAAAMPGPGAESALVNRGRLLVEIGRLADGRAALDQALAAFPTSVEAHSSRADLVTFAPDDPAFARMESLLGDPADQSHLDRTALNFALGKAYLDVGDSERAFRHLHEGNRLKRSTVTYDAEATSQWMKAIAEAFTADLFERLADSGAGSALPVFVLGMPRSGTTLIEQILASHPQVHGAGELPALARLAEGMAGYPAAVSRLTRDDLLRLGAEYLARVEPLAGAKRHLVDKMPVNFLHIGLIRLILPNARIVHCRRDPVDTCLSCYSRAFESEQLFTYDLRELGRFHGDYRGLMAHWRAVTPADRFLDVDYEAVVEDLEGEARRLIGFLGLPWDDACLRFHENRRPVRTASVIQVRQPIHTASKGRWKAHARQLGPLLEALDVGPDSV